MDRQGNPSAVVKAARRAAWPLRVLLLAGVAVCPFAVYNAARAAGYIFKGSYLLATNSIEELRVAECGDRNGDGYGYVRDILAGIPDDRFFPFTRYANYTRGVRLVFPGFGNRIDRRMIVGIDLQDAEMAEGLVAEAIPVRPSKPTTSPVSIWAFQTIDDYDQMTAIVFLLQERRPTTQHEVRVTLVDSPKNPKELGSWMLSGVSPWGPTAGV